MGFSRQEYWSGVPLPSPGKIRKGLSKCLSEVCQSCPTLCDPMDCSPPGSSVHGILQARILEWVAISFSRGSSRFPNLPHYKKHTPETCKPPYNSPIPPQWLFCHYQIVPKSLTIDPWWTQMYFCDTVHAQGFYKNHKCQTVKSADISPETDLLQATTFSHKKPT